MTGANIFSLLGLDSSSEQSVARLGQISLKGRKPIETPDFLAITSRGVVPHLTPDVVREHTQFGGVHLALEDCKL
jgi:queuine tRNA-ribosyltransferase accessory subunit